MGFRDIGSVLYGFVYFDDAESDRYAQNALGYQMEGDQKYHFRVGKGNFVKRGVLSSPHFFQRLLFVVYDDTLRFLIEKLFCLCYKRVIQ